MRDPVAQWIRHLTTNHWIPGSNPGGVGCCCCFFFKKKILVQIIKVNILQLLYGSVSPGLETSKFTNLIGSNRY